MASDPYFVKYHLALSTTNHAHHHLLLSTPEPVESLKICPLYDVFCDHHTINPLKLDCPLIHPRKEFSVVGSCNGLICFTTKPHNYFIWNPTTRKSIELPDLPLAPRSYGRLLHAFGYNESSEDYNVVVITYSFENRYDNIVMIYSSNYRNWKEIDGFPFRIWRPNGSNVFFKGALHWIASKDCGSLIVVSLDLAEETYGELWLPVDEGGSMDLKLGILGDCLFVLCDYSRNSSFGVDVWVMKVYGVKDSWLKLISIPYDRESVYWHGLFSAPLCVSHDGKVLLQFDSRLIVFEFKDDSALETQKFNGCYEACTFVESLVSPTGHENLF